MPALRNYDLFISHAWRYGDEYERLVGLLNQALFFRYRNFSALEHKPLFKRNEKVPKKELVAAIDRKIKHAHCVLVIGGMYAAHRDWIQKEIELAQVHDKPIICVKPRGSQVLPKVITEAAVCEPVDWMTDSIVGAIRAFAL